MTDLLSTTLLTLRAAQRQPSLSAAVARDGRLTWADAVGEADPLGASRAPGVGTRYRVASITKPQVAVAVLQLVEEGAVRLGTPLREYLPDAPCGNATVAQFLSHTSGLPAEPAGPWWERAGGPTWADLVAMDLPQLAVPGTRFHYSNVGYGVLGHLVEVLRGQRWDAVLAERVWGPLGMDDTGTTGGDDHAVGVAVHPFEDLLHPEPVADYRDLAPSGAAWSTPSDLVRFGSFLLGAGDGQGVLHPDTLALMRTPHTVADVVGAGWSGGYGLGQRVLDHRGRTVAGHTGSVPGFTADLCIDPVNGVAVAVCGNATTTFGGALGLLDAALRDDATGHPLEGTWFWGPRPHVLTVRADGVLTLDSGRGTPSTFTADGADWVGTGGDYFHGERLRVVSDHQLDVGTFCFTREPYDPRADLPGGADAEGWRARP